MNQPVSNMNYSVATGSNSNKTFITVLSKRQPTANDINYAITQRWVNTETGLEYILIGFTSYLSSYQANWLNISAGGSSNLSSLTGNIGGAVTPTGANINVIGDTSSITITGNPSTSSLSASVILPNVHTILSSNSTSINGISPSTQGYVLTSNGIGAEASFQPIPASGITWSEKSANFIANVNNGYFINGTAITAKLPTGTADGETIYFVVNAANPFIFQADTTDYIQIGTTVTAVGGSASISTSASITLVFMNSTKTWFSLNAPQSVWNLT